MGYFFWLRLSLVCLLSFASAGHIDAGSDSITSAIREMQEELGLTITPTQLELLFSFFQEMILNDGKFIDRVRA